MEHNNPTSAEMYSELKEISEQKTNCLFEYLQQVQELKTQTRQLQLSDEIRNILREHDEKLRGLLLREGR